MSENVVVLGSQERAKLVGFKEGIHDQRKLAGVGGLPWLVVFGGGASAFASRERARREVKSLKERRAQQVSGATI